MFSMIVDSEIYKRIVNVTCLFLYILVYLLNTVGVSDFKISAPFKLK